MTLLDAFNHVNVLCLGDVMLDRFVTGAVKRISPESPVPVLSVQTTKVMPGGAANVARNIAALGGRCTLVGVVGQDAVARELGQAFELIKGVHAHLIAEAHRPTTEKTRFVANGQHMLRTDTENAQAITADTERQVLATVAAEIQHHQVMVLSDYAKGMLTEHVIRAAIALAQTRGIPVVVDPKSAEVQRYAGATILTPNAKEAFEATGIDPAEDDAQAVSAGQSLLQRAGLKAVLITRAHKGMTLVTDQAPAQHIRASAREVFDVVGAGDTVVSTLALSLGAGQTLGEAAHLANAAAGIVVGKRGTATVSQSELLQELHQLGQGGIQTLQDKVLDIHDAVQRVANWRRDGLSVGFTNGCFDILHVGHLSILGYSKAQCSRLVVGLNSDASVRRLKGAERPINDEQDRAMVIAGLAAVDAVVVFDDDTPLALIKQLLPDVLIKGADYTIDQIVGAQEVIAHGGRVVTCPLVPGRSTTRVVNTLRQQGQSS